MAHCIFLNSLLKFIFSSGLPKVPADPTGTPVGYFRFALCKEFFLPKTLIILAHPDLSQSVVNKQWFDEVLTHGWAYGSKGKALTGRKIALAVSLGTPAEDYRADGAVGCSVADVLRPFELTAKYCGADYRPPFAFHTIDSNAGYGEAARKAVGQSAADYLARLEALQQA